MILVDTSVWVQHLRLGTSRLVTLLEETTVLTHPFVIGEIALGQLEPRQEILGLLADLPGLELATDDEVLTLIDRRGLAGCGIGWIDAHLLAAALVQDVPLWTLDRRLEAVASQHGLTPS